nr:hypothetical protein [uncultured Rhodoferax sp.]
MDSGLTFAQTYNLRPGIALTAEQLAVLTTDIVWLQQETVNLPDGTQTVALVPHLYATVRAGSYTNCCTGLEQRPRLRRHRWRCLCLALTNLHSRSSWPG